MEKTFEEWVALYEKKTGVKFVRNKGFKMFFWPDRGFCEVGVLDNMVVAWQLCGEGKFWRQLLEAFADALNKPACGTVCVRHIKPYIRFWGAKIKRTEITPTGQERYFCETDDGVKLQCSPAWVDDDTGEISYFMTWEVKKHEL